MAWADKLKPYYEAGMKCENCGKKCTIKITKGVKVTEAIKNKELKCDNCKVVMIPKEYTTQWLK